MRSITPRICQKYNDKKRESETLKVKIKKKKLKIVYTVTSN